MLEVAAPRVNCAVHGPTVAAVPWARHGVGHTYVFDEQVAWLATQTSQSAVTELMRIAWRTVGAIITRVWDDVEALTTGRRPDPGRDRRDLLQARPPVPHRRGRTRFGPVGVGRARTGQGHPRVDHFLVPRHLPGLARLLCDHLKQLTLHGPQDPPRFLRRPALQPLLYKRHACYGDFVDRSPFLGGLSCISDGN